jgi:multiple antibiotic resistance protein
MQRRSPLIPVYSTDDMFFEVAKSILLIVSALFPVVNPIGGSPIFLLLTQEYSTDERKLLARRVAINSFFLLIVSVVVGTHILSFFGISLAVVQVGGGLVVISTGWAMLTQSDPGARGDRGQMHQTVSTEDILTKAFYPLTLPLTVGPGSISIAITLGANEPRRLGANLIAILAAAIGTMLIALSVYVCYAYADKFAAAVGPSGMNVILRLSAFLLVCIGVQILWNGVKALVKTLAV